MKKGQGKLPWPILQAFIRVGQSGSALFEDLQKLVAGEMTARLQGKISALKADNRYLDGELIRVTRELYIHRDQNLTAYSEDNRGLKEELDRLKGVEQELVAANNKVREQQQQLAKLPTLTSYLEASQKRADDAKAKGREYNAQIQQLEKEKLEFSTTLALDAKVGFDQAVDIVVVLEPSINFEYLDAKYEARDGKIYLGDEVAYDPEAVTESPDARNATAEDAPRA